MKTALIAMANGTEDIEAITTLDILNRAGIKVTTASVTSDNTRMIRLSNGTVTICNMTIDEVCENSDIVIVPGGPGTKTLASSEKLITILKKQKDEKRHVAAICAAPGVVLYNKGIIDNGTVMAGFPGTENGYDNFTDKGVEVSGNGYIITGRAPAYTMEFALTIVKQLIGISAYQDVLSRIYP